MGSQERPPRQDRFRRSHLVWLLASITPAIHGCSNDDTPATATQSAIREFCSAECIWYSDCGMQVPPNCTNNCARNGGFVGYGRQDFYRALSDCLAGDSECASGADAAWQVCWDEASLSVEPTQSAYDLCELLGKHLYECGSTMAPTTCARQFSGYNDDTLEEMQSCSGVACDTLSDCLQSVVEKRI